MSITVHLTLRCSGCPRTHTTAAQTIRQDDMGYTQPSVHDLADSLAHDDGWIVRDPYTHLTYCPTCWRQITLSLPDPEQARGVHPGRNRYRHRTPPGRTVLAYLRMVDSTGEPPDWLTARVRALVAHEITLLHGWPARWPTDSDLDELARQIGWRRANAYGHFDKALALIALEDEHAQARRPVHA